MDDDSVLDTAMACKYLERVNTLTATMLHRSFIVDRHEENGEQKIHIRRGKFPNYHSGSPECDFIMKDAMYRAFEAGGYFDEEEGESEDWSLGSSGDD